MIEGLRCKKQYIGETKRILRERFKEYRKATNNPNHSDATAVVSTHFNLPGHCAKDMRIIPLELQRPSNNGSRRKAREAYPIERGEILSPDGINRRHDVNKRGSSLDVNYFCIFQLLYMYPMDRYIGHIYSYMYSSYHHFCLRSNLNFL